VASSQGKRVDGPCGHVHEFVFNQFSMCTVKGCDGRPGGCHRCGSLAMRDYYLEVLRRGVTARDNRWLKEWVRIWAPVPKSLDADRIGVTQRVDR
jgi:hypothetical protein